MIVDDGPRVYRCSQGVLYVKRSEDPQHRTAVKLKRPVGTYVYSTGWLWQGPLGGTWAEFDASKGEMGWVLVKGPGFGLRGQPALLDATRELGNVISLSVQVLGKSGRASHTVLETLIDRDSNIAYVKSLACEKAGLDGKLCSLVHTPRSLCDKDGKEFVLPPSLLQPVDERALLESLPAADGHLQLHLIYMHGDALVAPEDSATDASADSDDDDDDDEVQKDKVPKKEVDKPKPVLKYGGYQRYHAVLREMAEAYDDSGEASIEATLVPSRAWTTVTAQVSAMSQSGRGYGHELHGSIAGYSTYGPEGTPYVYGGRLHTLGGVGAEFDDDEVQFGPGLDPMELPDLGYGAEIEWIDAD